MSDFTIHVNVSLTDKTLEALAQMLGGLHAQSPSATVAPAASAPIVPATPADDDLPEATPVAEAEPTTISDTALRKAVKEAVAVKGRETVKTFLEGHDWFKTSSIDCPQDKRTALLLELSKLCKDA